MSAASTRTLVAFLLALSGGVCAARAEVPAAPVAIRIYDGALIDAAIRRAAIETATAIVAEGGLDAVWHDCTPDTAPRRCDLARGSRELMIRIMPTPAAPFAPEQGSTVAQAAAGASRTMLGFAVVPPTGTGVLATIFMDRVRATAQRTTIDASILLGRAIAHEVGHLVLGTSGHADRA